MELILILKKKIVVLFFFFILRVYLKKKSTITVDFAKAILQLPLISRGTKLQNCVSIRIQWTSAIQTILLFSTEI